MSGARHKVNQLEFVGSIVDGAAGNRTSASFRRKNSHRPVVSALALHADHWLDTRDQLCQTRLNCTFNDERHVLVGSGRFLCNFTHRLPSDENALAGKVVDYLAPLPLADGFMPAHGSTCAVNSRAEGIAFARSHAGQNKRRGAHAAANQYRLADMPKLGRQVRMGRAERACRTLSVNVKIHESAAESVLLHLAGIVRDVIEQLEFGSRE